jgi:hypothetical protein
MGGETRQAGRSKRDDAVTTEASKGFGQQAELGRDVRVPGSPSPAGAVRSPADGGNSGNPRHVKAASMSSGIPPVRGLAAYQAFPPVRVPAWLTSVVRRDADADTAAASPAALNAGGHDLQTAVDPQCTDHDMKLCIRADRSRNTQEHHL